MYFFLNALKKINITLLLIVFFNLGQSFACSCNFLTVEEAVNYTPIIFRGKVSSIVKVPVSETFQLGNIEKFRDKLIKNKAEWFMKRETIYRVEFEQCVFFKGEENKKNITVYTPISGATCGYRFEIDETYIVYSDYNNFFSNTLTMHDMWDVKAQPNQFWTNLCTRNTTEEERALKAEFAVRNSFIRKTFRTFEKSLRKAMTH